MAEKVLQSLNVSVGRCFWQFYFFLTYLDKQTVSLQHSCVFCMMKCVATGLKYHLKTVPSYNLLQTEVLHHIYKVKLEALGFTEGRNTYSGQA